MKNTGKERAILYREFCEWCNTVPHLDLDPRLHTHSGRIEDGGYISNGVTATAFAAWKAARRTQAAPVSQAAAQEPFGYFKAEPFGWRDCAETDEGAIALYEAPQPQADARDAQRYRWLIDYFISDRVDLDDAIVAAKTSEDIAKIIDAAIAAAQGGE